MKLSLYIQCLSLLIFGIFSAQVNRSQPPKPLAERPINFGEVTQMNYKNGLTLLVVENHKLPTVNVSLILENGPIHEGSKKGIQGMFADMMLSGTENFSKAQIDDQMDYLGSRFLFRSQSFSFSSLKSQLYPTLDLYTEVLFRPTFQNIEELEKLKKQEITFLASSSKNPNTIMSRVEDVILYGKNDPNGEVTTEETINNIELKDFPDFYENYFIPNHAFLVFVGDITPKEAEAIYDNYFKKWKKNKKFSKKNYPLSKNTEGNYIAFIDLPKATQSVINISNLSPLKKSNPDYFTAIMGNSLLGGGSFGRLFKNIREDKGWTYGAGSVLRDNYERLGYFRAYAKVRNSVTDSAIREFRYEIDRICKEVPSIQELQLKQAEYKGNFVIGLESPNTIASFTKVLIEEKLPSNFYKDYTSNIQQVRNSNIPSVMQKYIDPENLVIIVVGNGSEVVPQLETLGMPIQYFDIYGNNIPKPEFELTVSKNISVNDILTKGAEARGSITRLEKIKSTETVYESMDKTVQLSIKKMAPNLEKIEWIQKGQSSILYVHTAKGAWYPKKSDNIVGYKGLNAAFLMENTDVIPEIHFLNMSKFATSEAIEKVNGKNAYRVDFDVKGNKESHYFDYFTGERVMSKNYIYPKGSTSEIEVMIRKYSDYNEVNGVKVPQKLSISLESDKGNNSLEFTLKRFEINKNIPFSEFTQ